MSSDSVVIRVENVSQRFRVIQERPDTLRELFAKFFKRNHTAHEFEAVRNISFEIRKGEMVGLIGRNGSGKSTLLKVISGIYRPSTGSVSVTGNIAPLLELGAGFHPELTGRENILINGLLMGYSKRDMKEREQRIINFAEIGDFIDAPVKQYSSGMYMRLAFSVATEVDPDILIIDEILAVGDAPFQQKCFERLEAFRKSGKTILFVSHALGKVVEYCSRGILIDKGEMIVDGTAQEAVGAYELMSGVAQDALVDVSQHS